MNQKLYLSINAIDKITKQTKANPNIENGGMMFGRMNPSWVKVYDVSDAGPKARRSRFGIEFDNQYIVQYAIEKQKEDLFFIGTWHSHPQGSRIYPSRKDYEIMYLFSSDTDLLYRPVFCISKWENEKLSCSFFGLDAKLQIIKREFHMF